MDIRLTEVHAKFEEEPFVFLLRIIERFAAVRSKAEDPVEVELRRLPRNLSNSVSSSSSSSSLSSASLSSPAHAGARSSPMLRQPGRQQMRDSSRPGDSTWVGWLLGAYGCCKRDGAGRGGSEFLTQPFLSGNDVPASNRSPRQAPSNDLLSFDAAPSTASSDVQGATGSSAVGSSAAVALVAIGVFVQDLQVTLHTKEHSLCVAVEGLAVEVIDGATVVAADKAEVDFDSHSIATLKSAAPASATTSASSSAPVEQWAFELFASQSGAGNRSVGIDASKRLFLPNSLFDPNGSRLHAAAGLEASASSASSGGADVDGLGDGSFVVGGDLGNTPRKLGRSPSEKPSFRTSGRQPEWQRGCGATELRWHTFDALLLRVGPALHEAASLATELDTYETKLARFGKRPIHWCLSICANTVQALVVPSLVPFLVRFFAKTTLAAPAELLEVGIDPMELGAGPLLDRALSRVWRKPSLSVEVRVARVKASIDTGLLGYAPVHVTANRVSVTDNWRSEHYPGLDFIALARNYKLNPLFATKSYSKEQSRREMRRRRGKGPHNGEVDCHLTRIDCQFCATCSRLFTS